MKSFKFLQENNIDIPTPQEIRASPWLTIVYWQGWNAAVRGVNNPPAEYNVSPRSLNVWYEAYRDAQNRG